MDIKLKRNENTYIVSEDYRHHIILACYANNILAYKIDLSNSLLCTTMCENYAIITSLYFDEKDTFKVIYKDDFAFCNCNRNLEYLIARYENGKEVNKNEI